MRSLGFAFESCGKPQHSISALDCASLLALYDKKNATTTPEKRYI
jgi:hypothetical protein